MNSEIKKVALAYRVSSLEQKKEGWSLEAQLDKLRKYAQENRWEVYDIYVDSKSAKDIKGRKDFKRLLKDAIDHKFDAIIVTKFDRAFRNTKEALTTIDELEEIKVKFISISEDMDIYTAFGRMYFTIIMAFAELELGKISERVDDIQQYKFKKGLMVGKPTYGYKFSKQENKFIIIPKKAEIIKDIFNETLQGTNWKIICEKYRIPMKSYYNILRNKTYTGIVTYKGEEILGSHEAIIDPDTFQKIQERFKKKTP